MPYTWTATLWWDDIPQEDHEALGLARLIWQYRGSQPRIQAFLAAYLEHVQSIEDLSYDVLVGVWPWTAIGAQLDTLGKIVRQDRQGMTDSEYRLMILGRIFVNRSTGTLADYIELLVDILGVAPVQMHELWSAGLHVGASGMTYPDAIGELLFDMKPGGVELNWVHSTRAVGNVFRCSSLPGTDQASVTEGTSNIAYTTGGYLADCRWT